MQNDNDVSKDGTDDKCREETEMTVTMTAVTVVLVAFVTAAAVLAVSDPSAVTYRSWLTVLIIACAALLVGLLARWLRAVLRDNRATRQAVRDARDDIAELLVCGQQQTDDAVQATRDDLARRVDEINEAFARTAMLAQDEVDRKRRVMNGHN